jgi:hypothetical protein
VQHMLTETATIPDRPGQFLLSLIRARQPRRPLQPADMSPETIVARAEAESDLDVGEGSLLDRVRRILGAAPFMPPQLYAARGIPAIASLLDAARDESDPPLDADGEEASDTGLIDPAAYATMHATKWRP